MSFEISATAAPGAARPRLYAGWRIVFVCFWLAVVAWGIGFYGHGVYLADLKASRGWSTSLLSIATTSYYIAGAILVMFVGATIDRFGPRAVVLVSTLALCLALVLLSVISAPWQLFPVYLLMAVGWAGTSWTAIPTILARWFDRRRGLTISIAFTGASAGGIIVPPLLIQLSAQHGFQAATEVIAAAALLILVPLVMLFLDRGPQALGLHVDGADAPPTPPPAADRATAGCGENLHSLRFWTTATAFALALTSQVGFLTHQIAVLAPALGAADAGLAVAMTTTASIAGRIGLGVVIDRLDPRTTSAIAFVVQAAAVATLIGLAAPLPILAACIVYGVWIGNIITLPALIIQREFPPSTFGAVMGWTTSISQFSFAFGPGALGLVRDASANYGSVLAICAALNVVAAALILCRGRARPSHIRVVEDCVLDARPTDKSSH